MKNLIGLLLACASVSVFAQRGINRGVEGEIRKLDLAASYLYEVETTLRQYYPRSRAAQEAIADILDARESVASARDYLARGNFGRTIVIQARGQGVSQRNDVPEACTRARTEGQNEATRLCRAQYGQPGTVYFTDRVVSNPPHGSAVCTVTANLNCDL